MSDKCQLFFKMQRKMKKQKEKMMFICGKNRSRKININKYFIS